jgi:hypothetical protein
VPNVVYQALLNLLRPEPYARNRLKRSQVVRWCAKNDLVPQALYRYALPPYGTSLFAGQEEMYRLTRFLYGPSDHNRNGWMGNQFLYFLQKT